MVSGGTSSKESKCGCLYKCVGIAVCDRIAAFIYKRERKSVRKRRKEKEEGYIINERGVKGDADVGGFAACV